MFVISICIAPIFAGEYQNRTDALLLATKHGKNKLISAKIMASFIIIFLTAFLLTAISLLLSSANGNPMIVLAVDVILFFGTIFIPFSKTSRLWNRILYLFPIYSVNLKDVLKTYNSYQFGDVVIPYLSMIFIVYVLITVICIFLTRRSFKKHQIGK